MLQRKKDPLMITFYVSRKNGEEVLIKKIDKLAAQWRRSRSYVIIQALKRLLQEGDQCGQT